MADKGGDEENTPRANQDLVDGQESPNHSIDIELNDVHESLKSIENIMIAENKRRIESNQIMSSFIEEYLKTLRESITNKVDSDFVILKKRVAKIDNNLNNISTEIDTQIEEVKESIDRRSVQINTQIEQASTLIQNI